VHVAGVSMVQATSFALMMVMPVLAIKRFHAGEWGSLLVTAAPTVFYTFSIFWHDVLRRRSFGSYLWLFWLVGCLPVAAIAFASEYWMLLVPHLLACVGGAAWPPANGEVLHALYPASIRARMYSITWGIGLVAAAGVNYGLSRWLTHDENAFRVFLPIIAAVQGAGLLVLTWLSHASGHAAARTIDRTEERGHWAKVVEPVVHMGRVLKADPVFARYEAAYMTYGVGWMIAYALLPILVTRKLHLDYDQISWSTQVAYLLALVAVLYAAALMMDRLGAVRTTGLSFLMLSLYPVALALVRHEHDLLLASVYFGVAHAGASVGWTVGPVSLAPSPDKVPAYMAIHATMVGIRGKLFQGAGVLVFWLTHSFTIPLVLAGAAYAWAAWQMWALHKRTSARAPGTGAPVKAP
jgi:hypothetical protein